MIIKQDFMPKDHPSRPGIALNHPKSITIHWIGPYPRQAPEDTRNWWLKGPDGKGVEASAHFIIKDDKCLQCIPEQEIAWHAGCRKGNYTSLGIEVIPLNTTGEFSSQTIDTLIQLLKRLPKIPLVRHYDWTSKDCPRFYTNSHVSGDGRVPNPEGGDQRWEELVKILEEGRDEI
jgi:N-acetylmuramoyl-L-alanine amidase CwlA